MAPNGTRVAWIAKPGGAIAWSSDSGPTSACGVRTPMRTVASQPSRFHLLRFSWSDTRDCFFLPLRPYPPFEGFSPQPNGAVKRGPEPRGKRIRPNHDPLLFRLPEDLAVAQLKSRRS